MHNPIGKILNGEIDYKLLEFNSTRFAFYMGFNFNLNLSWFFIIIISIFFLSKRNSTDYYITISFGVDKHLRFHTVHSEQNQVVGINNER